MEPFRFVEKPVFEDDQSIEDRAGCTERRCYSRTDYYHDHVCIVHGRPPSEAVLEVYPADLRGKTGAEKEQHYISWLRSVHEYEDRKRDSGLSWTEVDPSVFGKEGAQP